MGYVISGVIIFVFAAVLIGGFMSGKKEAENTIMLNDMLKEKQAPNLVDESGKESLSNADELLKYKELLDKGAITQEEFDAKKKALL